MASVATSRPVGELTVRERLVRAAAAVINDVGEEQLTLAEVVRRAGLTTRLGALVDVVERAQARDDIDPERDPRALALLLQQLGFALVLADLSGDLAPDPDQWVELVHAVVIPLFAGRLAG